MPLFGYTKSKMFNLFLKNKIQILIPLLLIFYFSAVMASSKPAVVRYTQEEFKELTIQCLWFCLAENAHKKKIKKDKIIEHCLAKDKKQLDIIMKSVDCLLNSVSVT